MQRRLTRYAPVAAVAETGSNPSGNCLEDRGGLEGNSPISGRTVRKDVSQCWICFAITTGALSLRVRFHCFCVVHKDSDKGTADHQPLFDAITQIKSHYRPEPATENQKRNIHSNVKHACPKLKKNPLC
jgi:hypothetical protein